MYKEILGNLLLGRKKYRHLPKWLRRKNNEIQNRLSRNIKTY